jgi:diaminopimelate decarboxylase
VLIVYAAKAYLGRALARLIAEEGLGLDVVSGGELACATAVGFPLERVYFHGNNKSAQEVRQALTAGVGRVVVDNFHDLALLGDAAASLGRRPAVLLRVTPGVDPHTHAYVSTEPWTASSACPWWAAAPRRRSSRPWRHRVRWSACTTTWGPGSRRRSPTAGRRRWCWSSRLECPSAMAWSCASTASGRHRRALQRDAEAPSVAEYADTVVDALREGCGRHQLPLPRLVVEPGRAIVARAGVALYTVGATKEVPGVRTYVAVDGGMADNIRPALYGARYEALVANRMADPPQDKVTVAGRYCESGDVLVTDVALPRLWAGDTLALPVSGAYALALASNYNWALRPAVVIVKDGRARLIRRRETYDDLLACDC